MPKVFTSKKQKLGEIGENVAIKFLQKNGFNIIERNYTKKYGEIDIIANKDNKLYFIEVKSVSCDSLNVKEMSEYRPEENLHPWKMKRMARVIQVYLLSKKIEDQEWQTDLIIVFLDLKNKSAKIKVVSDFIL